MRRRFLRSSFHRTDACYYLIAKLDADLATEFYHNETDTGYSESQHIQTRHSKAGSPIEEDRATGRLDGKRQGGTSCSGCGELSEAIGSQRQAGGDRRYQARTRKHEAKRWQTVRKVLSRVLH